MPDTSYIDVILLLLGIDICTPEGNTTAHAVLLQCSADLPARAPLTNMKQYSGCWECLYCDSKGTTHGEDHLHRFWPHDPHLYGQHI